VVLVILVGGAAVAVAWYARGTYFVGLNNDQLVTIYKGRPGGLLWFQPTVVQRTGVRVVDVLPTRVSDLKSGMEESSLSQARAYVVRIQDEATTTTTTPTSTSVPASPPPSATTTTAA
jgi:PPM family protein phosphatase